MGVIGMAAEIVGGMVGMGYVCHRIEQMMLARNGYDTRDFFRPIAGPTASPPVVVAPPIDLKRLLISEEQERLMAQSFLDNPTAFWLDPNLWGDDPDWQARLFPPEPLIAKVMRARGHIDKRKEAENDAIMAKAGILNPKLHFRSVMKDDSFPDLPCGCPWETGIRRGRAPYTGWHFSICDRCGAEWEPPSNDPTGRRLGQGESVHPGTFHAAKVDPDAPRPNCPKCGRSHPRLDVPLNHDGSEWAELDAYFTCTGCRHQWDRHSRKEKKRLAKRDDYDNEMPPPPWTGGPSKPKRPTR